MFSASLENLLNADSILLIVAGSANPFARPSLTDLDTVSNEGNHSAIEPKRNANQITTNYSITNWIMNEIVSNLIGMMGDL